MKQPSKKFKVKKGYELRSTKGKTDEIHVDDRPIVIRANGYVLVKYEANGMLPSDIRIPDQYWSGKGVERWYRMQGRGSEEAIINAMDNMLTHVCAYRDAHPELKLSVSIYCEGHIMDINRLVVPT